MLVQEDVIAMIEGSHINTSNACALSVVTGIPVISLRRDTRPTDGCLKTLQIQAGYRTYAHATLDILNTFQWKNIALLYEGKPILWISIYNKCSPKPTISFRYLFVYFVYLYFPLPVKYIQIATRKHFCNYTK